MFKKDVEMYNYKIETKHVLFNNKTGDVIYVDSKVGCLKEWAGLQGWELSIKTQENDEYYNYSRHEREMNEIPAYHWTLVVEDGLRVVFEHSIDMCNSFLTREDESELFDAFLKYFDNEIHNGDHSIMGVDSYVRYSLEQAADLSTLERIRKVEYQAAMSA
jgi:hypothetical protein